MKQFKANNFDQALKEMKDLDKDQAGKLKEDINFNDRKHYHVIGVTIETKEGEVKNKVSMAISKHHPNSFEKFKKNFRYLGINRLIVLHDPTQVKEDAKPTIAPHEKIGIQAKAEADVKAEMEAEVKRRVDAEVEKRLAEMEASKEGNPTDEEILNEGYEAVMKKSATVEVIDLFAKDYSIEFGEEVKNKADKQEAIKKWFESKDQ